MIIFALGMPHSGADWVAHVAAGVLSAHDQPCQIVHAPDGPKDADDALGRHLSGAGTEGDSLILRAGCATPAMSTLSYEPNCRSLMTYRDPRDVCASLMRLDGLALEAAVAATAESFKLFREVFGLAHLTLLPYAHQLSAPEAMANQVAMALNTLLDRGTVQRIAAHAREKAGSLPLAPGAWETVFESEDQPAVCDVFQDIVDLIGSDQQA